MANMSTDSELDGQQFLQFGPSVTIAVSIVSAISVLVGAGGNGLVIYSVLSSNEMRTNTNILILNISIADCLVVLSVPFITITYIVPQYPFGLIWCKINQYIVYVCSFANVYTLVFMSINRYLAVVHSLSSIPYRTKKNICIAAIGTWTISLLGSIPTLMTFGVYDYIFQNKTRSTCAILRSDGKAFYVSFFVFAYLLPVLLVCILYGRMLYKLISGKAPGERSQQSTVCMNTNKRVTKMVITIVAVYAFCLLPVNILFLYKNFGNYQRNNATFVIETAVYSVGYLASCINPFIYSFMSGEFREKFKTIVCRVCYKSGGKPKTQSTLWPD